MNKEWHNLTIGQVAKEFNVDIERGLNNEDLSERINKYGYNILDEKKARPFIYLFISQFKNFLVIVLILAAFISAIFGEFTDSLLIFAIVILNAFLGIVQENKAEKSLDALRKMSMPKAKVIRDGQKIEILAKEIVPGDIIVLDAGDYIPADGRLIEAVNLKVKESALTGESVPVEKIIDPIRHDQVPLGDQKNLVFMSSIITSGRGKCIAIGTGMKTEIGKIADMIQTTEVVQTPLQKRLEELGKVLGIGAILLCGLMFGIGVLQGREIFEMFMVSVSLAVAVIPEGLPAIVTIVLAMGVQRLITKNAIIRKLPAVETLGSASVICTDKTGTLTQNKMTVKKVFLSNREFPIEEIDKNKTLNSLERLVEICVLCNDAEVNYDNEKKEIGDPTEIALIDLAKKFNIIKAKKEKDLPRVEEIPFDSDRKLMTTIHKNNDSYLCFTKGAPDEIIKRCKSIFIGNNVIELDNLNIEKVYKTNDIFSNQALRVLGFAYKEIKEIPENISSKNVEKDLVFVGLTGMIDPPREEVRESINLCLKAGIKPVMITGDHKKTAIAIAKDLMILKDSSEAIDGIELDKISDEDFSQLIDGYSVYARVSPSHKVRIVDAWQKKGHVVAMTGDGVNDAPALKKADIGCAMGITGTDVSKEAAEMVLTDDNFSTIVSAVEEGRGIYANIKKSIHFLISCNIGEIIVLFFATLFNWAQPLLPIHILWVNLITDSLPALALGVDPKSEGIMDEEPRDPNKGIFSGLGFRIIYQGIVIGVVTLLSFWYGWRYYGIETGRTLCFSVLALSQLSHSLNVRSGKFSVLKEGIFKNKILVLSGFISSLLVVILILIPSLRSLFKLVQLTNELWLLVIGLALLPLIIVEVLKFIFIRINKN